ncbi:hypothetical protein AA313_de0210470 [Arthrobotrys entomopaga]|nr:hypothetical protein AA313_de0210470 [Arthrobotrys entomopaga]
MSPSRLFLNTFAVALTLAGSVFGAPSIPRTDAASQASIQAKYSYILAQEYSGPTFFDKFDFFSSSDPTHGFVTYGNRQYAEENALIDFDGEYAIMRVDTKKHLNSSAPYFGINGVGRKSVRIEGRYQFTHGLVLIDLAQMPSGICGAWPAFWTLGDGPWPYHGEIDIIEGANLQTANWATLHTGQSSNITNNRDIFSGKIKATDCDTHLDSPTPNFAGCTIEDSDRSTWSGYRGGVWATQWTSDAIKMWFWPYGSVPEDVTAGSPQPGTLAWGIPRSSFAPPENVRIDENFKNQHIIFDTTFCGDLGDATWNSTGCAVETGYANCADFVAENPSAFKDAIWKVKYVKIFGENTAFNQKSHN